ncbi:MAG: hypothetical protein M5R36_09060 [Deltaproteobacteria bacterium]|nr:hypothetical protein [Deltaproteobacteria bacterium]
MTGLLIYLLRCGSGLVMAVAAVGAWMVFVRHFDPRHHDQLIIVAAQMELFRSLAKGIVFSSVLLAATPWGFLSRRFRVNALRFPMRLVSMAIYAVFVAGLPIWFASSRGTMVSIPIEGWAVFAGIVVNIFSAAFAKAAAFGPRRWLRIPVLSDLLFPLAVWSNYRGRIGRILTPFVFLPAFLMPMGYFIPWIASPLPLRAPIDRPPMWLHEVSGDEIYQIEVSGDYVFGVDASNTLVKMRPQNGEVVQRAPISPIFYNVHGFSLNRELGEIHIVDPVSGYTFIFSDDDLNRQKRYR